jgi:LysR family transcriptional regulator, regulator for bpeEF and oprC
MEFIFPMEDLNGLRVFLGVADSRSFTAAATRLGLTPSAVSKAIGRLEKEYGQRLLNRTTRHVSLTNDGHAFYERCRQVLADLEEAENHLTQSSASPRGHLRVHMPTAFGKKVVLPQLPPILERLPDLRIDVELGERPLDLAEEGLDAVVRFGSLPDSGLIARRLCDVRFVACASPEYLQRHGTPATPDDLHRHACLGYATPWRSHYREWIFAKPDGAPAPREVSGKLNVNSAEALTQAAIAGSGITMVADFVAWEAVRAGHLRVLLKDFLGPAMPVSLVYLPGRQHSPRIRWFLQTLQEMIPSPAPWEEITRT